MKILLETRGRLHWTQQSAETKFDLFKLIFLGIGPSVAARAPNIIIHSAEILETKGIYNQKNRSGISPLFMRQKTGD